MSGGVGVPGGAVGRGVDPTGVHRLHRLHRIFAEERPGGTDPALVGVTALGVAIGVAGLLVDAGLGIEEPDADDPVGARSHV